MHVPKGRRLSVQEQHHFNNNKPCGRYPSLARALTPSLVCRPIVDVGSDLLANNSYTETAVDNRLEVSNNGKKKTAIHRPRPDEKERDQITTTTISEIATGQKDRERERETARAKREKEEDASEMSHL